MNEDISILKEDLEKANKRLESLEGNLCEILNVYKDAIAIFNHEKDILFFNPAFKKLFGEEPKSILNDIIDFSLIPGETKEFSIKNKGGDENHILEMQVLNIYWKGEDAFLTYFHEKMSVNREARAYDQGKLEIVDTILHNIGNAINSVSIGIGTIQEKITNNRLTRHFASLANAVKENQDNFSDYVKNDPQGQKVAPFIVALADDFVEHDEELSKILSRVNERTQHIADIIRTQRIISRQSIYKKNINLKEAIDNAIAVLHDSIKKMNIQVDIDFQDALSEISTQESEFHQMLVNLIKNSVEAIGELSSLLNGNSIKYKPFIKVSCYAEGSYLIMQIKDNGIGIEIEKLELIFRSGYTTKKNGNGLGLHSIANFVNGCNGNIVALSDGIGKGATMEIKLPL